MDPAQPPLVWLQRNPTNIAGSNQDGSAGRHAPPVLKPMPRTQSTREDEAEG